MDPTASRTLAEAALRMHEEPDHVHTVHLLIEQASELLGADDAGVMLTGRDGAESFAATSARSAKAHRLQIVLNEGPTIDCLRGLGATAVDDAATNPRWPELAARADTLDWRSLMAVPLGTPHTVVAAIDFYAAQPGRFDDDALDLATTFARHASIAFLSSRTEHRLRRAAETSNAIGVAAGILMERHGLDQQHAFALLRNRSRSTHTVLSQVARDIIRSHTTSDRY